VPARVFVAIELPPATRELLTEAMGSLLAIDRSWRGEKIVAPELLHVTLAFFGEIRDASLPPLLERLRIALGKAEPFALCVSGARAMPSMRRATMLWAMFDGDTGGAALLSSAVAREAGLPPDARPFRAHVTLARSRKPRAVTQRAADAATELLSDSGRLADRTVSVRSATVYSSTLGSAGPTYEPLALLALGTMGGEADAR
jgi:2'-5' RNA ligase